MTYTHTLLRAIGIPFVVAILGIAGYMAIEGWSFLDAAYMTVITMTTVGYREVAPLSQTGMIFTLFLIITGVGSVFYAMTAIMAYIVEGQFQKAMGRFRMKGKIEHLRNHYIICGYGRVGQQIAREFIREGESFVIIDASPDSVERCAVDGFLHIHGDAARDEILLQAGIERAKGLVTAVDSDADNIYVTLSARVLRPDLNIVARANMEGTEPKLIRAGANRVISPYSIGGRRMATHLTRPLVADFLDTLMHSDRLELLLEEIEVGFHSPLANKNLVEARQAAASGASILALKKKTGEMVTELDDRTIIEVGDKLVALGTRSQMRALEGIAVEV